LFSPKNKKQWKADFLKNKKTCLVTCGGADLRGSEEEEEGETFFLPTNRRACF
jgi:hypothetical protein